MANRRHRFALPLRVGSRMIGVGPRRRVRTPSAQTMQPLMREVDEHALRIDTALIFDEVRSLATTEERQRLAREIHDGVAQEIASLGYVVDDLASTAIDGAPAARAQRPARRAHPGGQRAAAVDLRPAQRDQPHGRARLRALRLRALRSARARA